MRPHVGITGFLTFVILSSVIITPAAAQAPGLPVFFDPTYSYVQRIGIDLGHGGVSNGLTVVGSGSKLFYIGNCPRLAISAAAGFWQPSENGFDAAFTGGSTASILLNSCPSPLTVANPTIRLFVGGGFVDLEGHTSFSAPVGLGMGYMFPWPIVRIEPWITPRLHYRESALPTGGSSWDVAFSVGANVGMGGTFGLRVAADCCEGGLGGGYGLSVWF